MKIDKVLQTSNITTKDGKQLKKTMFMSDDKIFYTFSDIKDGDEREEVGRKEFTKNDGTVETTINFKSNATGGRGGFGGVKSDPDTMLIAYSSQLTASMIQAGILKKPEEIANNVRKFAALFFGIHKLHKEGKDILPEKIENTQEDEISSEEIDIEDLGLDEEN